LHVDRPGTIDRGASDAVDEPSMRWLEYVIAALAAVAAFLLGFLR
jgi:hypothetical protein